ncbi:MAG TPA: hypothetical protein VGH86_07065 [Phenylobacterium sp.]|jgi:hypothetical protein
MQHRLLKAVGFSLLGLAFVGFCLSVLVALMNGKPNIGTNFYGLPIGTYSTAAVLLMGVVIWLVFGATRLLRLLKQGGRK